MQSMEPRRIVAIRGKQGTVVRIDWDGLIHFTDTSHLAKSNMHYFLSALQQSCEE